MKSVNHFSVNNSLLIVDDVPANLRLLNEMLSTAGYDVSVALSGEMALDAISQFRPALILLDVMMPDLNGFEVCQKLKKDKQFCSIPIIFISALEDVDNKLKAFTSGGVDYITKPFQSEEVLARVATHLNLEQTKQELELAKEQAESAWTFLAEAQSIAHLGSWDWDIETGKYTWSAEMFRIFGYEPDSFSPNYDTFNAVHPDDKEKVSNAVEKAMHRNSPAYDLEYRIIRPDGTERIVHDKGVVYHNDVDGHPVRMIGTVLDITERTLVQRALIQNEKMSSVGGLAAGMAHELNNPLAGIIQGIQNIERRLSTDFEKNIEVANKLGVDLHKTWEYFEQREISNFLQGMEKSGERAAEIVNSILSFARMPQMKQLLAEDPGSLIDRTIELEKNRL